MVEEDCIGCRLCEYACPVEVPDAFEGGMGARRAAYIPFTNAIPQTAVIDPDECILCGRCVTACPTDAVVLDQQPEIVEVLAQAVVATTGWKLTPLDAKAEYHAIDITNVLAPTQMERLLAPHGPYGRVLRPSDGKAPESLAYVQCAGSRDQTLGVPYCSRVCCMYAIKQAMLLSGSLPFADITIYYMDIRAFGKGYEEFYRSAKVMGIEFVKGKVARLTEAEDQGVVVRVERRHAATSLLFSRDDHPAHGRHPEFQHHRRIRVRDRLQHVAQEQDHSGHLPVVPQQHQCDIHETGRRARGAGRAAARGRRGSHHAAFPER